MKRREFLALSSVAAVYILTGCGGGGGMGDDSSSSGNVTPKRKQLPIPELLHPTDKAGVKHYDLTIQEATHDFFESIATHTFALNKSTYLGPTLLIQNGESVSINYTNRLTQTVTMHGHGMHVPPSMDGTAHQPIAPGETWSAAYTVKQKASMAWYHPHTMDKTAEHVYKGLAGLIIIEESESKTLDLPRRYGIDDIPLVLQDRIFTNGQIDYSPSRREVMHGYVGDTLIVNGAIEPVLDIEAKEIRFRILNGSNASVYELGFSDGRSFKQIATDSSFLESPVELTRLTLSPAERAEIVVDFSEDLQQSMTLQEFRQNKTFLTVNVNKSATSSTTLPATLTTLEKLDPAMVVKHRSFELSGSMGNLYINGKSMDINRIDETVTLNSVEIWEVTNSMMMDHNFHIHATHFMILERNGSAANVVANEKGYKDVVFVPANESVKFIVKMVDYSDATVPYMYHCHFLEHEDAGMMGQFIVIS